MEQGRFVRMIFSTLFLLAGCAEPPAPPLEARPMPQQTPIGETAGEGVANLPFARGRVFRSLDEYLAYRRELGATDIPYYEEISPGIFRLTGGMRRPIPGEPARNLTRAELAAQFGFTQ